jgi:hypothetical protein
MMACRDATKETLVCISITTAASCCCIMQHDHMLATCPHQDQYNHNTNDR